MIEMGKFFTFLYFRLSELFPSSDSWGMVVSLAILSFCVGLWIRDIGNRSEHSPNFVNQSLPGVDKSLPDLESSQCEPLEEPSRKSEFIPFICNHCGAPNIDGK